jgi:hypothetical protein
MFDFTNFREYENRSVVFHFKKEEEAEYFENMLTSKNIYFEKYDEKEEELIYYAVKRIDFKDAQECNYLTSARFRKPFIAEKSLRFFIIGISLLMILLAIAGMLLSPGNA